MITGIVLLSASGVLGFGNGVPSWVHPRSSACIWSFGIEWNYQMKRAGRINKSTNFIGCATESVSVFKEITKWRMKTTCGLRSWATDSKVTPALQKFGVSQKPWRVREVEWIENNWLNDHSADFLKRFQSLICGPIDGVRVHSLSTLEALMLRKL